MDTEHARLILKARVAKTKPGDKIFSTTAQRYRAALQNAGRRVGYEVPAAHSVRHSGPSRDAAEGYRSLSQIQRRGRWTSPKSVLRYAKAHVYIAAKSQLPEGLLQRGLNILRKEATAQPAPKGMMWSAFPARPPMPVLLGYGRG